MVMVVCLPRETKTYNSPSARAGTQAIFRSTEITDGKKRQANVVGQATRCPSHDNDGWVQHTLASCNIMGASDMDVLEGITDNYT